MLFLSLLLNVIFVSVTECFFVSVTECYFCLYQSINQSINQSFLFLKKKQSSVGARDKIY